MPIPDDEQLVAHINETRHRCTAFLGGRVVRAERGKLPIDLVFEMEFDLKASLAHSKGTIVQGGFVAACLDDACYYATVFQTRRPDLDVFVLESKINYLGPQRPGKALCRVGLLHLSSRIVVAEASILQQERSTAKGSVTSSLVPSEATLVAAESLPRGLPMEPAQGSPEADQLKRVQLAFSNMADFQRMWHLQLKTFHRSTKMACTDFEFPMEMTRLSPAHAEDLELQESFVQPGLVTGIADAGCFVPVRLEQLQPESPPSVTTLVLRMKFLERVKPCLPVQVVGYVKKVTAEFTWLEAKIFQSDRLVARADQVCAALRSKPPVARASL